MKQKKSASRSKSQQGRQNQNKQNQNTRQNLSTRTFGSEREQNGRDQTRMMPRRRTSDAPHFARSEHELSQAEIENEFGRDGVRMSGARRRSSSSRRSGSESSPEELIQYVAMILDEIEDRVRTLSRELERFGGRQGRGQGRQQWGQQWSRGGSSRFERASRYRDEE
jgi:hypothetical protein